MTDSMSDAIPFIDVTNEMNFSDFSTAFASSESVNTQDVIAELEEQALSAFYQAIADIKAIRVKRVCQVATSFGKDSTLLLLAALEAHKQLVAEGKLQQDAPFVISSINTGVENHLMTMLVQEEVQRLKDHCEKHKINLKVHFATPPLAKTWSALFLSGKKMLSLAALNSDCSILLKIENSERIEKDIEAKHGKVCILVGSRLDESVKRAQSLKNRNQASRDVMDFLAALDEKRENNVFAPISHISTEQVWLLLRRAGSDPMKKPTTPNMTVPSYADNHLLLSIIYGDSTDGTCPTTSKNVGGQGIGGCGKSARTGCSLCLKVLKDTSGEAQIRLPRHSVISENILKIRNYMAFVGQDMSKRSWHTRAIDQTTGAIAAYPNVLNGETIDELIKYLIQCTADEYLRANQFKQRVRAGDEMLDKGYSDIMHDAVMSEREKALFADVYKRHAQSPLHTPITFEICLYLSFIHARDGMKLPPYRAVALWDQLYVKFIQDVESRLYEEVEKNSGACLEDAHALTVSDYEKRGLRLPYPDVDLSKAPKDTAPDAVMIMPEVSLDDYDYVPHTGIFNADDVVGCMIDIEHDSVRLPLSQAEKLLPSGHGETTKSVSLRGFKLDDTYSTFLEKRKDVGAKKEISKRAIAKVARKGGEYRVVQRGRTSVGSHSFSERTANTVIQDRVANKVVAPKLSLKPHYIPLNEGMGDVLGTYAVSFEGLCNWEDYDGLARALALHDEFIENKKRKNESIYHWSGIQVVEQMQRYGLFDMSDRAIASSMFNLKRTSYFGSIGLFRLSDEAFQELASSTLEDKNYSHIAKKFEHLYVKSIMPMLAYRRFKANMLLDIRAKRNAARKAIMSNLNAFLHGPLAYDVASAQSHFEGLFSDFEKEIDYYLRERVSNNFGKSAIEAYAKYLSTTLVDEILFARYLSSRSRKAINKDLNANKQVRELRYQLYKTLKEQRSLNEFHVEWAEFTQEQVSLKRKPVEYEMNFNW